MAARQMHTAGPHFPPGGGGGGEEDGPSGVLRMWSKKSFTAIVMNPGEAPWPLMVNVFLASRRNVVNELRHPPLPYCCSKTILLSPVDVVVKFAKLNKIQKSKPPKLLSRRVFHSFPKRCLGRRTCRLHPVILKLPIKCQLNYQLWKQGGVDEALTGKKLGDCRSRPVPVFLLN